MALVILGLIAVGIANHAIAMGALLRFRRAVPELKDDGDMVRFRGAVEYQMYAALAQITLLGFGPLLTVVGGKTGWLSPGDVLWLIPAWGVVLVLGLAGKSIERGVQTMPVSDELREERDEVVKTWRTRPLPTW